MTDKEADSAPDRLVDAIVQLSFTTMAELTRLAAAHELSLTQLRVLGILRDRTLRMSQLVDYLGLEKSTLTGLVARAEARGLMRRSPSASDGRVVEVSLTSAGRRLAADVARRGGRQLGPVVAGLSRIEQERLAALLEKTLESPD